METKNNNLVWGWVNVVGCVVMAAGFFITYWEHLHKPVWDLYVLCLFFGLSSGWDFWSAVAYFRGTQKSRATTYLDGFMIVVSLVVLTYIVYRWLVKI